MLLTEILVEEGNVPRITQVRRSLEELVDESVHFGHHVVADVFAANLRGMDMFNKLSERHTINKINKEACAGVFRNRNVLNIVFQIRQECA